MTIQFIRQVRITFGQFGKTGKQTYRLRVAFNVSKTKEKQPNTAEIQIYNLNEDSRSLLGEDDVFFSLETKYREAAQWGLICSGDVQDVNHEKRGPDTITTVSLSDGFRDLRDSTINKSFPAGTTLKSVVDDILQTFKRVDGRNLAQGILDDAKEFVTGGTFSGKSLDVLDGILKPQGLIARINNNDLIVEPLFETNETEAFLITPKTGLLGSPQKKTFTINKQEKKGITFRALLNPRIDVASIVKVESKYVQGEYIVYNINYIGDSHEGDFVIECECLER